MSFLDSLEIPDFMVWMLLGMLLLFLFSPLIRKISLMRSIDCFNCGKEMTDKKKRMCDSCFAKYGDMFPKDYKNEKTRFFLTKVFHKFLLKE